MTVDCRCGHVSGVPHICHGQGEHRSPFYMDVLEALKK